MSLTTISLPTIHDNGRQVLRIASATLARRARRPKTHVHHGSADPATDVSGVELSKLAMAFRLGYGRAKMESDAEIAWLQDELNAALLVINTAIADGGVA